MMLLSFNTLSLMLSKCLIMPYKWSILMQVWRAHYNTLTSQSQPPAPP